MSHTFALRRDAPWRWMLRLIGVRHGAAQVEMTDDGRLIAKFGRLKVESTLDNVRAYRLTGPYRWWKAIGPRASLVDHGFTFGSSVRGGVCLCFRDPVPSNYVRGGSMESLTVTVDDVEHLAQSLEQHGISGEDLRRP
ncbi:MAG: hypothetical protein ACR2GO_05190 [Candidatus Limnocylindria bacterium]